MLCPASQLWMNCFDCQQSVFCAQLLLSIIWPFTSLDWRIHFVLLLQVHPYRTLGRYAVTVCNSESDMATIVVGWVHSINLGTKMQTQALWTNIYVIHQFIVEILIVFVFDIRPFQDWPPKTWWWINSHSCTSVSPSIINSSPNPSSLLPITSLSRSPQPRNL